MTNFLSSYVKLYKILPTLTEEHFFSQLESYMFVSNDNYSLQTLASCLTKLSIIDKRHHEIALQIFNGQFQKVKRLIKNMTFRQITAAIIQLSMVDKSLSVLVLSKITDEDWITLAKTIKSAEGIRDGLNELKSTDSALVERIKLKLV